MNRRHAILGLIAATISLPAAAAEPAQRRSRGTPTKGSGGSSNAKPGVAERSNNRVRRATESNTAGKVKTKANKGDAAMNRLVGRRGR